MTIVMELILVSAVLALAWYDVESLLRDWPIIRAEILHLRQQRSR